MDVLNKSCGCKYCSCSCSFNESTWMINMGEKYAQGSLLKAQGSCGFTSLAHLKVKKEDKYEIGIANMNT